MEDPRTFAGLKGCSVEELKALYDEGAHIRTTTPQFLLDEIHRREANNHTQLMLTYTRRMTWLTVIVTILTAINVVVVLFHH